MGSVDLVYPTILNFYQELTTVGTQTRSSFTFRLTTVVAGVGAGSRVSRGSGENRGVGRRAAAFLAVRQHAPARHEEVFIQVSRLFKIINHSLNSTKFYFKINYFMHELFYKTS